MELEVDKWYFYKKNIPVVVRYISEDLVVIRFQNYREESLTAEEASRYLSSMSDTKHGDEIIMNHFDSSIIYRSSYIPKKEMVTISFKYNPQKVYIYTDVCRSFWDEFVLSRSKGKFYNNHLKRNDNFTIDLKRRFGDDE